MRTRNMQRRIAETPICRFCLEEKTDQRNPLIAPCDCKGSIEFIHLLCLNRWRMGNVEDNYEFCNLCNSPYILDPEYSLEPIPGPSLYYFMIDYPIITNLAAHYGWILSYILYNHQVRVPDLQSSYIGFQSLYAVYYCICLYNRFRIHKRQRYYQAWLREHRYLFFPFLALLFGIAAAGTSPFFWTVPSLFVPMFWHLHIHILKEMNREDLAPILRDL